MDDVWPVLFVAAYDSRASIRSSMSGRVRPPSDGDPAVNPVPAGTFSPRSAARRCDADRFLHVRVCRSGAHPLVAIFRDVPQALMLPACSDLHDWNDAQNLTILSRCRSAMPAHARLLVVELVAAGTDERTSAMA